MTCERMREQIPACLAGQLENGARETLIAHLDTCPACRAEMAELAVVWRGLGSLPLPEPDPAMKARFLETLEAYQMGQRTAVPAPRRWNWEWFPARPVWQAAAAVVLLLAGMVGGQFLAGRKEDRTTSPEVARLQGQVESLRQLVALSLLQEQSPSARLRGVTYSYQMAQPDRQVEQALLHAVNHDPNVNVRLSAVDALEKYAANPEIRRALVDAVPVQDSPLVQIALIDLLVQLNDQDATPALRKVAVDGQANDAVRQRATAALQKLEISK